MVEISSPTPDEAEYRLPRTVVPSRYEITMEPDLDQATFSGSARVQIEIVEPTSAVVLNAAELEIDGASIEVGDRRIAASVRLDTGTERAHLDPGEVLEPGPAVLEMRFRGLLNDQLRGFYRSTFTDDDGATRVIATTQFEATDARRAFPCWDEPDRKAVFAVTLVAPEGLLAISNSAAVHNEPTGDGRRRVRFADTIPMSTYLVAFVVGPLAATEPVDVDGVPLRVVHQPGREHLAAYPLEAGAFFLRFFSDYYGIDYPGDKVDLVALPDFAFGAMENLGAITFREALLLVDPASVAQAELQRIADVIAHELAHMWFGDLVTMRWWNGLWLNEAFATFMELLACDAFAPEWERWVAFARERAMAFDVDSLASTRPIEYPVRSPEDANGMFDVLTYQKGASVLRMLEQYLGAEQFRAGIRHYLSTGAYGNAETTDLWDAIEHATGAPVRRIMDTWILQGGHPAVTVRSRPGGVVIEQRRFRYLADDEDGAVRWSVPVILRRAGGEEVRILLEEASNELDVPGDGPVVVNSGGHGFYRVRYGPDLFEAITAHALEVLTPVERAQLVDDTWAAVLAGETEASSFVTLAERLAGERNRTVWEALLDGLDQLDSVLDGDARASMQVIVRDLVAPALAELGWEPAPQEPELTRQLRGTLIRAAGILGVDEATRAEARQVHERYLADPASVDPDVAAAVTRVAAHAGDRGDFDAYLARYRDPVSPQEQLRYLYALALFDDDALVERTLELCLGPDVRTQNAPFLILMLLRTRRGGEPAWRFVREHWELLNERFPVTAIPRMLAGISRLSSPAVAADVEAFFAEHDVPQGRAQIAQHLERLRVNVALRQREADRFSVL